MTPKARTLSPEHAARLLEACTERQTSFALLRTSALVLVAWGGALRLSEVLALDIAQVLADPKRKKLSQLRETAYLRADQSESPGAFVLTHEARDVLRDYLRALIEREWLALPSTGALYLTIKGGHTKGAASRTRLGKRAAQLSFEQLQARLNIRPSYRFGDLRHDALMRFGAVSQSPFAVAQFGRMADTRSAVKFVRSNQGSLAYAQIAAIAQGAREKPAIALSARSVR